MKIIYDRKELEQCVEFVNMSGLHGGTPAEFVGACENIVEAFLDENLQRYKGITYVFEQYGDTEDYICYFSCRLHPVVEPLFYEIELPTDELPLDATVH